ncbi:hypothetical protein VTO42DRAFT_3216 [Malbranchea cinnamomea]
MASSFFPVNNGVAPAAPPTDPALLQPRDSSSLPKPQHETRPHEQQSERSNSIGSHAQNGDQGNTGGGGGDRHDKSSVSSASSLQSNPPPTGAKPQGAAAKDGSAQSDGHAHESEGEREGSEHGTDAAGSAPAAGAASGSGSAAGPPSKKKKGQRFFCTDFPPCNLSFTRSEHLARHIRKHTGERPFQCHCSRRFSRLDNLRQHAQTVHVNEDIPGDSLAASVTRVQRQIRTDRIRATGRARAGTAGSATGVHARGHSRNLSASSIGSTVSYAQPQDLRRHPPPLIMANDPASRAKLTMDTMAMASPPRTPPNQVHAFTGQSPNTAFFTPSSANYSAVPGGEGSPYYVSPASSTSGVWADSRGTPRRLSFPTGTRPFDVPQSSTYPPPFRQQALPANANYGGDGTIFASPSSTTQPSQDSFINDLDWRRRTWHPSSPTAPVRPATSGLWVSQTSESQQPTRLPGIESFDRVQLRPSTPPRREPTPMQVDRQLSSAAPPSSVPSFADPSHPPASRPPAPPVSGPGHRRGTLSIDTTLQRTLTKLDLRGNPPPPPPESHPAAASTTPSLDKGQSWLEGRPLQPAPPLHVTAAQEQSPSRLQTLATMERRHSYVLPEYLARPATTQLTQSNANAKNEPRAGMYSTPEAQENGLGRLEALVAVATSESKNQFL